MTHQQADRPRYVHWVNVPCRWFDGKVRLRARCRQGETAVEALKEIEAGESGRPYILEGAGIRELHFTRYAVQSSMLIDSPYELVSPYTRKMMAFLLFVPRPKHILMIGLGGGSLTKYCYHYLSACSITVVEANPEVIALRDEFLVPRDDHRLRVIEADGAEFVARTKDDYDVVLVDAFDHGGIARPAYSRQFYHHLAKCLSPHGVLVMNLVGADREISEHTALGRALLDTRRVLVPVRDEENMLVFGLRSPALQSIPDRLESVARRLQRALNLDFPYFLTRISAGTQL